MGILDKARNDAKRYVTDAAGFAVSATFTAPTTETATVNALHSKHHLGFNEFGKPVSTKNAHISFSESDLMTQNPTYPLRNSAGEVSIKKHKVVVADSTGLEKTYTIIDFMPNETLGIITCILGGSQ